MYLVSCYFDEKTNEGIGQYIRQIAKAFEVLQKSFGMFEGTITRIGLAKTNPYHDVINWDLS